MKLPAIDKKETKYNVHRLLTAYRNLELMADEEYSPNVTQSFSADIKGSGGKPSSAVETAVIKKVDSQNEVVKIQTAVSKLSPESFSIICDKYLNKTELTDAQVYDSMNISKSTFYRKLEKAQIQFALAYDNGTLVTLKRDKKETAM